MTDAAPILFDQSRCAQPARAHAAGNLPSFLEELAVDELADRLSLINRQFHRIGIVSFAAEKLEALVRPALAPGGSVTCHPRHLPATA
jgi:hypothetical protein